MWRWGHVGFLSAMDAVFLSLSAVAYSLSFFVCQPYGVWYSGVALLSIIGIYMYVSRSRFSSAVRVVCNDISLNLCVLYVLVRILVAVNRDRVAYLVIVFPFWVVYSCMFSGFVVKSLLGGILCVNLFVVFWHGIEDGRSFHLLVDDIVFVFLCFVVLVVGGFISLVLLQRETLFCRILGIVYVFTTVAVIFCPQGFGLVSYGFTVYVFASVSRQVRIETEGVYFLRLYATLFPVVVIAATIVLYHGVHLSLVDVVFFLVLGCCELGALNFGRI